MNQENVRGSFWNKRTFSILNFGLLLLAIPVLIMVDGIMLLLNTITKLGRLFAVKILEKQHQVRERQYQFVKLSKQSFKDSSDINHLPVSFCPFRQPFLISHMTNIKHSLVHFLGWKLLWINLDIATIQRYIPRLLVLIYPSLERWSVRGGHQKKLKSIIFKKAEVLK